MFSPEEIQQMVESMAPAFREVFRDQHRVTLAAAALRGLLAREDYKRGTLEMFAEQAVALADAVLAKLERRLQS